MAEILAKEMRVEAVHPDAYRNKSGLGRIVGMYVVAPGKFAPRTCYKVEYPDGVTDFIPVSDFEDGSYRFVVIDDEKDGEDNG